MKAILLTAGVLTETGRQYDAEVVVKAMPEALEKVKRRALLVYSSQDDKSLAELDKVVGVVTDLEFDGSQLIAEIEMIPPHEGAEFRVGGTGTLIGHIVRDWSLDAVISVVPESSPPAEPKHESKDEHQD